MTAMHRINRLVRTVVGMSVLLVIGTWGLVLNMRRTRSSLTADLPSDLGAARDMFDRRVRDLARPGTPVEVVTRQLRREGFNVDVQRAVAIRKDRFSKGRKVWRVMWETSGVTIASIRPSMGVSAL